MEQEWILQVRWRRRSWTEVILCAQSCMHPQPQTVDKQANHEMAALKRVGKAGREVASMLLRGNGAWA